MTATLDSRRRRVTRLAGPLACGAGLATVAGFVVLTDQSQGSIAPSCPIRALTGHWCPGCGLTRATHHLFHGDLVGALRYHLLVPFVLAATVVAWVGWVLHASGRATWPVPLARRFGWRGVVAASAGLVGFAIVRNLPGVDGLRG